MPDEKEMVVIYPVYFDSTRSRSYGRMVPSGDATKSPTIDQLVTGALKAGYKPEIEREKKHPATWAETPGRILIKKEEPKSAIIRKIARAMKGKAKR